MTYTDISATSKGVNASTFTDYSVSTAITDAADGSKETKYFISKASQYLGYYKQIPELKMAIDTKATWTIGKGNVAPDLTSLQLSKIGRAHV